MFENLAEKGIKEIGNKDIETIKTYHGDVLIRYALLCVKMGLSGSWIYTDAVPDNICSGYRDHNYDPEIKNSPHKFGIALDICVSKLSAKIQSNRMPILTEQMKWITKALDCDFTRAGIYPYQNTIHLDIADKAWMEKYNGTPYWVKDIKAAHPYVSFYSLNEAFDFAKQCANRKD